MNPTPDPREGSSINNRTRGWIRESERWTKSQPDESLVRKFTYVKKNQIEMLKVEKKINESITNNSKILGRPGNED